MIDPDDDTDELPPGPWQCCTTDDPTRWDTDGEYIDLIDEELGLGTADPADIMPGDDFQTETT